MQPIKAVNHNSVSFSLVSYIKKMQLIKACRSAGNIVVSYIKKMQLIKAMSFTPTT